MKKNLIKFVALLVSVTLMFSLSMAVTVRTPSDTYLNGNEVWGTSTVTSTSASSSTHMDHGYGTVNVTGTYYYINVNTLNVGTSTDSNGSYNNASVSFSAPTNCRSVKEVGSHKVVYSGMTWTASTTAIY